jgi:hypothetical protein
MCLGTVSRRTSRIGWDDCDRARTPAARGIWFGCCVIPLASKVMICKSIRVDGSDVGSLLFAVIMWTCGVYIRDVGVLT